MGIEGCLLFLADPLSADPFTDHKRQVLPAILATVWSSQNFTQREFLET